MCHFRRENGSEEDEDDLGRSDDDSVDRIGGGVIFDHPRLQRQLDNLLERLFGTVLPNHPSLTDKIRIVSCDSRVIELLASSFPTERPLDELEILHSELEPTCVEAIASMIRRDVQIRRLEFSCCSLGSAGGKKLCDAVVDNEHVTSLRLGDSFDVLGDTLSNALSRRSPLNELEMRGLFWTDEGFATLVECLKINETLQSLIIRLSCRFGHSPLSLPFGLLENLIAAHNFTLWSVSVLATDALREDVPDAPDFLRPIQERIDALLDRNAYVREANEQLKRQRYRVVQRSVWPKVMQRISSKPALLYRFLRCGNLDALADHLCSVSGQDVSSGSKAASTGDLDPDTATGAAQSSVMKTTDEALSEHGTATTRRAVVTGSVVSAQCVGCDNWMQVTNDATALFCSSCSRGLSLASIPEEEQEQMSDDLALAVALQQEEYEMAEQRSKRAAALAVARAAIRPDPASERPRRWPNRAAPDPRPRDSESGVRSFVRRWRTPTRPPGT
jgi:hypothetical protein